MNLTSPKDVTALLERHGIRPNKTLGQNFLIDRNILDLIVESADLKGTEHVLEVGAGLGVLTERLMEKAAHVTAVEKDAGLHSLLEERWAGDKRLTLMFGDALELKLDAVIEGGATRLVSNLPYAVGVRVVVDAAVCATPPEVMTVLLQKEVGERFAASPGTKGMGAVSVLLQQIYDVKLVRNVKPSCFFPRPEVTSVIIKMTKHNRFALDIEARRKLHRFVREAFLHRRKQLASAMRGAGGGFARDADFTRAALQECGALATARPEELSVGQWIKLSEMW